jgi:hypothetical protein
MDKILTGSIAIDSRGPRAFRDAVRFRLFSPSPEYIATYTYCSRNKDDY